MARVFPSSKKLKRRGSVRAPTKEIVIICEGRNTEPRYIKDFARDKKHPLVSCITIDGAGVPKTIVDKAIIEKKKLLLKAKKDNNSFEKAYEVWCVSDRDEHPRVPEEMQRAKDNGLKYVLSNPCIELWGYLHYAQNDAPTHHHKMQRKLSAKMPDYDHNKTATFNYPHMSANGNYLTAVKRAEKLADRRMEESGNKHANPSTNMYELMASIEIIGTPKKPT